MFCQNKRHRQPILSDIGVCDACATCRSCHAISLKTTLQKCNGICGWCNNRWTHAGPLYHTKDTVLAQQYQQLALPLAAMPKNLQAYNRVDRMDRSMKPNILDEADSSDEEFIVSDDESEDDEKTESSDDDEEDQKRKPEEKLIIEASPEQQINEEDEHLTVRPKRRKIIINDDD
jgi:pyruvate-formate lyase-activating enzyme